MLQQFILLNAESGIGKLEAIIRFDLKKSWASLDARECFIEGRKLR